MDEFPDDVIVAAREAAAKAWAGAGEVQQREFRSSALDDSASVQSAAFAIMAERKRCAGVAERDRPYDEDGDKTGPDIAEAIMRGD